MKQRNIKIKKAPVWYDTYRTGVFLFMDKERRVL